MSRKKIAIAAAILVVAGIGWYAFRPELLFINHKVNEGFPSDHTGGDTSHPIMVATGRFHGVEHGTDGIATIYRLSDGRRVLRLTGFKTTNGPDLRLYAIAATDAKNSAEVKNARFVDLGKLKGNIGDQNYDIPSDLDLNRYRAITVWCVRFGVNFGTVPLKVSKS